MADRRTSLFHRTFSATGPGLPPGVDLPTSDLDHGELEGVSGAKTALALVGIAATVALVVLLADSSNNCGTMGGTRTAGVSDRRGRSRPTRRSAG